MGKNEKINAAILDLSVSLLDNSKVITKQIKAMAKKIEKNAGIIQFGADTDEIVKAVEDIHKIISKELNGIDTSKQLKAFVELFSKADRSSGEFLEGLLKIRATFDDLLRIDSKQIPLFKNLDTSEIEKAVSSVIPEEIQKIDNLSSSLKKTKDILADMKEQANTGINVNICETTSQSAGEDRIPKATSQSRQTNEITQAYTRLSKNELSYQKLFHNDIFDKSQMSGIEALKTNISNIATDLKNNKSYNKVSEITPAKLEKTIYQWCQKNTVAARLFKDEIDAIISQLKTMDHTMDASKLAKRFYAVQASTAKAGKVGLSWFDSWGEKIKSLGTDLLSFKSFFNLLDLGKKGLSVIHEFDDALTEMNKASDASIWTLKRYQKESFQTADSIGTTAKAIQNSTADWQRLGEDLQSATKSAKATNILLNVSEFDNINSATESLVAMSQAYKELDKMEIIDILNNIGSNFSISTDDLATALQKAAAVLKTQGNDINEAAALITAGNAIGQDSDSTAGGIRTISLRIAGTEQAKADLNELGEDIDDFVVRTKSKTDEVIRNYTAVASNNFKGVSVLDSNGNLRNTYSILLDISKVYKEIQESDEKLGTNRAVALVEELAGKNRSNIASSILLNPELLEMVYKTAQNSAGSAIKENEAYLESMSGHLAKFQNQWEEVWFDAGNRDIINFFIDLSTSAIKLIDDLGLLKTALAAVAGLLGAKGLG